MIISPASDWATANHTEALAFTKAQTYLPESDAVAYIGCPWSQLFSDFNQEQRTAYLQEQLLPIQIRIPASVKYRVSVCQNPGAIQDKQVFEALGITDIFCCNTTPRSKYLSDSSIRLWPFPMLAQMNGSPKPWADRTFFGGLPALTLDDWRNEKWLSLLLGYLAKSPQYELALAIGGISPPLLRKANRQLRFSEILGDAKFGFCNFSAAAPSNDLWEFIAAETIPVFSSSHFLPPGNPTLWREAAIIVNDSYESIRDAIDQMEEALANPQQVKQKLNALKQISKIYDHNFFISDIVEFFYNPELFILTRSTAYLPSTEKPQVQTLANH